MFKHKSKLFLSASLSASLIFLAACGSADATTQTGTGNDGQQMVESGSEGGTLVWLTPSAPVSLDPKGQNDSSSSDARMSIFEGLVRFNPHIDEIELEPALATDWGNIDEYTWYFHIREGVEFHDGAMLDADAVVRSLTRAIEDVASPSNFVVDMITDVVAVDDFTVHITTEFPFAPLPGHLAHSVGGIISPLALDEEESGGRTIAENPVGTGPFAFESMQGDDLLLRAVDNHWRQTPYVDYVRFWAVPEAGTRFALLETGEANAANIPPQDFLPAESVGLEIIQNQTTTVDYLGFNTQPDHVLSDVRIRQAIMHALNRQDIIDFLADGFGVMADGFLSPMVEYSPLDVTSLPYDMDRAAELLAEAGITPENRITLNYWFNEGNPFREQIGVFLQHSVEPLGIDIVITSVPWGTYLEQTGEGLHDIFILGWVTVTGDADYGLFPIFHSSQFGESGNRFFFSNPELDAVLEEGRQSSDSVVRANAYRTATEIVNEYVPAVPLRFQVSLFAYNGITGLSINHANNPSFELARFN